MRSALTYLSPFILIALTAPMVCTGCASSADPTTRDVLASAPAVVIAPAQTRATLHVSFDRGDHVTAADVALTVTGGDAVVRADDDLLALDQLDLAIADVALPEALFPQRLALTGLRVRAAGPMAMPAHWADSDEAVAAAGPGTLRLDWSLAVDGGVYPLASQDLTDLGVVVAAERADGDQVRVGLDLRARGVTWSWADLVFFADLDLTATGYTHGG